MIAYATEEAITICIPERGLSVLKLARWQRGRCTEQVQVTRRGAVG